VGEKGFIAVLLSIRICDNCPMSSVRGFEFLFGPDWWVEVSTPKRTAETRSSQSAGEV